jgi:S1-C subfamily serine protease
MKIKNIYVLLFALIFLGLLIPPFAHGKTAQINNPAVMEFMQLKTARENLEPSTFSLNVIMSFKEDKNWEQCAVIRATAFKVVGYFITSKHEVNKNDEMTDACKKYIAINTKTGISSLKKEEIQLEYFLMDAQKSVFPVTIKKMEIDDIAFLSADSSFTKKYKPVNFRSKTPIVDFKKGTVTGGKGPMFLSDEPAIAMGTPNDALFELSKGYLGKDLFRFKGMHLIPFTGPINSGNSGGPLMSLLDNKVIGMIIMVKTDKGHPTLHAGAIPFWRIQEALKNIDTK